MCLDGPGGFLKLIAEIRKSWLLLAYIACGLAFAFAHQAWWQPIVNYGVLVPFYVLAIRFWTRRDAPVAIEDIVLRSRRREWLVIAFIACAIAAMTIWFALQPPVIETAPSGAPDPWRHLQGVAINAGTNIVVALLPGIALCAVLRLRPRELGVRPRYLGLTAALVAFAIAFGLVLDRPSVLAAMPAFAAPIFVLHIFVNGLPEEFMFRALAMQRLLGLLRSPANAIAISTLLFDAAHWPITLSRGDAISLGTQPAGLVFAYLFYRTRSLWPGVLWHTSATILGTLFV